MSFLFPSLPLGIVIAVASIPVGILLLYFLKLRREPVEVPSTYLWTKAVEDLHVNSLMQRLRRNILLFLQILAVLLALLALFRPSWEGTQTNSDRQIFLLDSSASMQSTDVDGPDESRFAKAKRLISERIDAMRADDEAMLIAFSDREEVLQSFTKSKYRLQEALRKAKVTNRVTRLDGALRAASGLANPGRISTDASKDIQVADARPADLFLFSDGGFPSQRSFSPENLNPKFIQVGSETPDNVGITAFSADRNIDTPETVSTLGQVRNYTDETRSVTVTLMRDGEFEDAQQIDLDPQGETGIEFEPLQVDGPAELQLVVERDDDFLADNKAFAGIAPLRSVNVLMLTIGNPMLKLALETDAAKKMCEIEIRTPDYIETDEYQQRASSGSDDLVIYDRCAPPEMPQCNTMFVGAVPPGDDWEVGEPQNQVLVLDINRTHPLMRFLELLYIRIYEARPIKGPKGSTELLSSPGGSLIVVSPRDGMQDLVVGFEIVSSTPDGGSSFNTDWPIQRSWPVFGLNILRHLAGAADSDSVVSVRPGDTVTLRTDNRLRSVTLEDPLGKKSPRQTSRGGKTTLSSTDLPGIYRVSDKETLISTFAVNLFSEPESDITVKPFDLGYEEVESTSQSIIARKETWRWILLLVLGVLLAEWIIYTRRLM